MSTNVGKMDEEVWNGPGEGAGREVLEAEVECAPYASVERFVRAYLCVSAFVHHEGGKAYIRCSDCFMERTRSFNCGDVVRIVSCGNAWSG